MIGCQSCAMNIRLASPLRRRLLAAVAAAAAAPFWSGLVRAQGRAPISRAVPASGEALPAIGVGSWITFNVPPDSAAAASLVPGALAAMTGAPGTK